MEGKPLHSHTASSAPVESPALQLTCLGVGGLLHSIQEKQALMLWYLTLDSFRTCQCTFWSLALTAGHQRWR